MYGGLHRTRKNLYRNENLEQNADVISMKYIKKIILRIILKLIIQISVRYNFVTSQL